MLSSQDIEIRPLESSGSDDGDWMIAGSDDGDGMIAHDPGMKIPLRDPVREC